MGFQHDSHAEVIWITKQQRLPDVCCSCGLFTDNRVSIKHVEKFTEIGKHSPSVWMSLFNLALHIFGPIGWALSLILQGDPDKETEKTIKKKSKVKITQCGLCHATEPATMIETRGDSYSFLVHPKFRERLDAVNREDE